MQQNEKAIANTESEKPAQESNDVIRVSRVKFDDAIQSYISATREARCSIADAMDESSKSVLDLQRVLDDKLEMILRAVVAEITRVTSEVIATHYREPNTKTIKAELDAHLEWHRLQHEKAAASAACCAHDSDCAIHNEPAMAVEPNYWMRRIQSLEADNKSLSETAAYWKARHDKVDREVMAWNVRHAKLKDALLYMQKKYCHGVYPTIRDIVDEALKNDYVTPKLSDDGK